MSQLKSKILDSIHEQQLRPRPRWQYIFGHILLWSVCFGTLFAGSVAFSLVLMAFDMPERVFVRWMDNQEDNTWLFALPYIWLAGLLIALILWYFLFYRTERGYRFHMWVVAGSLLVGSLVFWWVLFATHAIHWGEERMQDIEPHYWSFRRGMKRIMPRPEEGLLPLLITTIDGETFIWKTPDGQEWRAQLLCHDDDCEKRKGRVLLQKPCLFEGKISGPNMFEATDVFSGPKIPPHLRKNKRPDDRISQWDHGSEKRAD